jgi:hypothetical protein
MIDFEHTNAFVRISIRERVQSGADDDELRDASTRGTLERHFRDACSRDNERAEGNRESITGWAGSGAKNSFGLCPEDRNGQTIFEHGWRIEKLMSCAPAGDAERGAARS